MCSQVDSWLAKLTPIQNIALSISQFTFFKSLSLSVCPSCFSLFLTPYLPLSLVLYLSLSPALSLSRSPSLSLSLSLTHTHKHTISNVLLLPQPPSLPFPTAT